MLGRVLVVGALVMWGLGVALAEPSREQARELFRVTDQALAAGEAVDLDAVLERLGDYPLVPYLRYRDLLVRVGEVDAGTVRALRADYPELPVLGHLEARWLEAAGAAARWDDFAALDRGLARCGARALDGRPLAAGGLRPGVRRALQP